MQLCNVFLKGTSLESKVKIEVPGDLPNKCLMDKVFKYLKIYLFKILFTLAPGEEKRTTEVNLFGALLINYMIHPVLRKLL